MYSVYGNILDQNPGLGGYRMIFLVMAVFAAAGFFLSSYILGVIKKSKSLST